MPAVRAPPRTVKKLLIISPSFPPMNAADMQRVRMSLPYYAENGWAASVLCVKASVQDGPREDALLRTLPPEIPIQAVGALPLGLCRLFGVGNLGLRSLPHMAFAGFRIIRRERPDLVFISSTQFALFPLARLWSILCGVPCVIDLQDPWVTEAYSKPGAPRPPGGWKYRFASVSARLLEGWSFRRLAGLISVSNHYIQDLRARHPYFSKVPCLVLGFGASEADLEAAPPPPSASRQTIVSVVYTGASGPCLNRILPEFLEALALLRKNMPDAASRLRIHFVGTSYVAKGQGRPSVTPLAEKLGVADLVIETPHRIGHLECLAHQRDADVLLLLGSADPAYSPSKLYPYLLSGRPILALAPVGSVLEGLLHDLASSRLISLDLESPPGSAAPQIAAALADASAQLPIEELSARNHTLFQTEFLARSLVRRQCTFFTGVLNSSERPTPKGMP